MLLGRVRRVSYRIKPPAAEPCRSCSAGGASGRAAAAGRRAGARRPRPVAPARACGYRRAGTGGGSVAAVLRLPVASHVGAVQFVLGDELYPQRARWRWQYDHMQRSL